MEEEEAEEEGKKMKLVEMLECLFFKIANQLKSEIRAEKKVSPDIYTQPVPSTVPVISQAIKALYSNVGMGGGAFCFAP